MKTFLLPNQFRFIGVIVIILSVSAIVAIQKFSAAGKHFNLLPLVHLSISIGLVMILSAREKDEDEMMLQLRLKSFQMGLYLGIFAYAFAYFVLAVRGKSYNISGIESLNLALLYVFLHFKYSLFKLRRSEKLD